jgi:uncharacterized membrane protein YhaH (DUF805 family)
MMHFVLALPENGPTGEYMIKLLGLIVSIGDIVSVVATIFSILPTIAVTNRRLRDLEMNTWLTPVFLIPCLNLILALIFFTRKSPVPETTQDFST